MATHIVNNAQKLGPAIKTFCDFPPAVADALEQGASPPPIPPERFCSQKGRLRGECSSSAEAE